MARARAVGLVTVPSDLELQITVVAHEADSPPPAKQSVFLVPVVVFLLNTLVFNVPRVAPPKFEA